MATRLARTATDGDTPAFPRERARGRPARSLLLARVFADVGAISLAIAVAFALRFGFGVLEVTKDVVDVPGHAIASAIWMIGVLFTMGSCRLYDEDTLASRRSELSRIRSSVFEGIAIVATAVFLLHLISVSRGWFVIVTVTSFVLLLLERTVVRSVIARLQANGRCRRPVVLVGGDGREPDTDEFDVVAQLGPGELGSYLDSLPKADGNRWVRESPGILLQANTRPSDELWDLVVRAGGAGLPVYVASPVRSVATDRITTRELDGHTIVKVSPPALVGVHAFEKRAYDVVVSVLMLLVLAAPMALIAVALFFSSGRPVFYGQDRVGRRGRAFRMWKFRTMFADAERDTGPVWSTKCDPRRTRLGRVLRKLSLDELPQLWNVLVGEMSIVGPRPERPLFVEEFSEGIASYRHRHRIRPGITGLAQVKGLRGDTALFPRIEADNRYIEHWSLLLDVGITLRTVGEIIRGRNAG